MTTSPETRAADLMRQVSSAPPCACIGRDEGAEFCHCKELTVALIAAAIKAAEADLLDRVQRTIRMTAIMSDDGTSSRDFLNGIAFAGQRLDTLKSKD